jgi:hypothetical protein
MSKDLLIERLRMRRLDGTPAAQDMQAAADRIDALASSYAELKAEHSRQMIILARSNDELTTANRWTAKRIAALKSERDRLRGALGEIAAGGWSDVIEPTVLARAALAGSQDEGEVNGET